MKHPSVPTTNSKGLALLCVGLFLAFTAIVTSFTSHIEWPSEVNSIERLIYLYRFYTDFFIAAGIVILLYGGSKLGRGLAVILILIFTIGYFVQYQSFSIYGRFLPLIALENIDHADFIDSTPVWQSAIIWLLGLLLVYGLIKSLEIKSTTFSSRLICALLLIVIASVIKNDKRLLNDEFIAERGQFYNSGLPGFPPESPLASLQQTLDEYQEYLYRQRWLESKQSVLSTGASEFAFEHYEYLGQQLADYPLVHQTKLDAPMPYENLLVTQPRSSLTTAKQKNVIVIFAEGISSRIIQPYSDLLPNISPHIAAFASANNIRINNYLNHTFATYRGLAGQLCSIYPIGRLFADTRYQCLPHVLQQQGYATRFIFSQQADQTDLDEVMTRAGFEAIDTASSLHNLLTKTRPDLSPLSAPGISITDQELMSALNERLKLQTDSETPFFYAVYNIETHTGFRLSKDDTNYVSERHNNSEILNTFHNFDKSFGLFWRYFKSSRFADNTIVVLTSDHATSPSREYLKLELGAPAMFIDHIPFLIYHPDITSNFEFDAGDRTSIHFAPTLLHVLDSKNIYSHFLGKSLFNPEINFAPSVAGGGVSMHHLSHELGRWIKVSRDLKEDQPEMLQAVRQYEFIHYTNSLEKQNSLWPENLSAQ